MVELGLVDAVFTGGTKVTVNVRLSPGRFVKDVPFAMPVKGMWYVPEPGDLVEVYEVEREEFAARFPHSPTDYDMPAGLEQGDFALVASGEVHIGTDGYEPVNIDHQSASAYLDNDQSVAGDSNYYIVEFDGEEDDPEDLFDPSTHEITVRHDGMYEVDATVEITSAGQNNLYRLSIFRNGNLAKRKSRQSAVNEPLSLDVEYNKRLNAGDVLDVRLFHDRGSSSTVDGSQQTSAFNIERKGI